MAITFTIARNPQPGTKLPYLLRIPVHGGPLVLKARDTWPRTSSVFCHRDADWPTDPEVVEEVEHVEPGFVADLLARLQIRYPNLPVVFCTTRKLAEEWTYRFLGAARAEAIGELVGRPHPPLTSPVVRAIRGVSGGPRTHSWGQSPATKKTHSPSSVMPTR